MLQGNPQQFVVAIEALRKSDTELAGGKGANLGELTQVGVPVAQGFVVTAPAYFGFLDDTGLRPRIAEALAEVEVSDNAALDRCSEAIQSIVTTALMPEGIASEIADAYANLGGGPVAVRSSATAEDMAEASFAGQQETYLNVEGSHAVVCGVQKCWASLFEARAIHYRAGGGFGQLEVGIAVVIQRMVQSERSGVMFTLHPVTNDQSQVLIEAVYGLGEAIVSGLVTPDMYVIDKATGMVIECEVAPQERELVRNPEANAEEANQWLEVDWARRLQQKLKEEEIVELAQLGKRLEEHFGCPQDIEWAHESGSFYILQSRAVTTLSRRP